jgi:hypothetical protein
VRPAAIAFNYRRVPILTVVRRRNRDQASFPTLTQATERPATTIPAVLNQSDAQKIAAQTADELVARSWDDLDRYEPRVEEVTSVNGRRFRVKSHASWDMDAWESDMRVTVKVYATRGWRRLWPVTVRALCRREDLPARST